MLIDGFDTDWRVLVVAEIGNNHEGDAAVAADLVRKAADAGVDAVKFQTFKTEQYVRPSDRDRVAMLKRFELSEADFTGLADLARELGLLFISTPFDLDSAAFLGGIAAAVKIASGDNNFMPLIDVVAKAGKPVLLSCGIAGMTQLRCTHAAIRRTWEQQGIDPQLAVLHCVSAYPVPPEQANLLAIRQLKRAFGCTVGYSDHALGIEAAALSVGLGARIVEKHFTLDKNYSDFRDHQLSADPVEMAELVSRIRAAETLLGDGRKVQQPCEEPAATALRRSIVAARDLPAGTCLGWRDLTWLRPGGGIEPGQQWTVLGRTLGRAVTCGEPITLDALEAQAR